MVAPLGRRSGRKSSYLWTWKIVVVAMLGNTGILRRVRSTSPWTSLWNLLVWTRWKSHLQIQKLFGNIRKGLITSLDIKTIVSSKEKKARYAITSVSMKDLSKIIREFKKLPHKGYVWKRSKHDPDDSYFYLSKALLSVWWDTMPSICTLATL